MTRSLAGRLLVLLGSLRQVLAQLWAFASALGQALMGPRAKRRKLRPWMVVRRARSRPNAAALSVSEADVQRLLERMRQLGDSARLTERAAGFAGHGADFYADPGEVEALVAALLRENPPFLHIAREQPALEDAEAGPASTEYLERESDVVITEPETLLVPQVGIEYLENKRPPGYPVLRAARSLSDLRLAPLLYQTLPEDLLIARFVEGSVPVLAYREDRPYLLFRPEERLVTRREHRRTRLPVEIECGSAAAGERLVYLLFDRSTSLVMNSAPRGINAVMELAIAVAMLRSDLGRPNARYYFRQFAERLDPRPKDPPVRATSVAEKDALVHRIFGTNFSGEATNVVEALETAADDIEHLVASCDAGTRTRPRIGLITDGRATLYRNTGARLRKLGIELDTILVGRDAARNPELMRISSTISIVDPALYRAPAAA